MLLICWFFLKLPAAEDFTVALVSNYISFNNFFEPSLSKSLIVNYFQTSLKIAASLAPVYVQMILPGLFWQRHTLMAWIMLAFQAHFLAVKVLAI